MWGASVQGLTVDIKRLQYDQAWTQVFLVARPPAPGDEVHDQWVRQSINLRAYASAGLVQLRFRANRGAGPKGDVAIDDIKLVCGATQGQSGTCICVEGFVGDGTTCTVDPSEAPEVTPTASPLPTRSPDITSCRDGSTQVGP